MWVIIYIHEFMYNILPKKKKHNMECDYYQKIYIHSPFKILGVSIL